MPPRSADPLTPVSRVRAVAGLLLLALWLGWSIPALWAQADAADHRLRAAEWTAAQVLSQLPPMSLAASRVQPVLLVNTAACPCAADAPLPSGVQRRDSTAALPFDWVLLADQRLVYAGPALLDSGCGGVPLAAAGLANGLLQNAQAPVLVSPRCPCHKE